MEDNDQQIIWTRLGRNITTLHSEGWTPLVHLDLFKSECLSIRYEIKIHISNFKNCPNTYIELSKKERILTALDQDNQS